MRPDQQPLRVGVITMKVTGTITKVIRTGGPAWGTVKPYRRVTLDTGNGRLVTLKYLSGYGRHGGAGVTRGQVITIEGMPMMGFPRVNIGGVTVTTHEPEG